MAEEIDLDDLVPAPSWGRAWGVSAVEPEDSDFLRLKIDNRMPDWLKEHLRNGNGNGNGK